MNEGLCYGMMTLHSAISFGNMGDLQIEGKAPILHYPQLHAQGKHIGDIEDDPLVSPVSNLTCSRI